MDETKQNRAIAEYCITQYSCARCGQMGSVFKYGAVFCSDSCAERASDWTLEEGQIAIEPYTTSLDAIHNAEMELSETPPAPDKKSDRTRFREILCVVTVMSGGPIHATAAQRAEAFLKTLNLWKVENVT